MLSWILIVSEEEIPLMPASPFTPWPLLISAASCWTVPCKVGFKSQGRSGPRSKGLHPHSAPGSSLMYGWVVALPAWSSSAWKWGGVNTTWDNPQLMRAGANGYLSSLLPFRRTSEDALCAAQMSRDIEPSSPTAATLIKCLLFLFMF